jgi:hypothetical protein
MFLGMPRVSAKSVEETTKPAPRKRAVRRAEPKTDAEATPRRRPRTVVREEEVDVMPQRKAPTSLASSASLRSKRRKVSFAIIGILLMVFACAAFIGNFDKGAINVTAKIDEESKKQPKATESVDGVTSTIPVQNTPPAAISGLKGQGVGTPDIVEAPVVAPSATTTDEVATSTEPVAEEVVAE